MVPLQGMKRRRTSYAWARLVDSVAVSRLSDTAYEGLRYAQTIADADLERCRTPIRLDELLPPMTLKDIADVESVSVTTVRRRIALAREELFGTLSMGAIYYRARRRRQTAALAGRVCAARDCSNRLPNAATSRRKFCHPRCRRREHYHAHAETTSNS